MRYLLVLFCLISAPAFAQEEEGVKTFGDGPIDPQRLIEEFGVHPNAQPGVEPEGSGTTIRPLDDSDPEMRERVTQYFNTVACQDPDYPHGHDSSLWQCRRAKKILADGGDRAAHYLIRQIEQNEREGWPNEGTYISLVGLTKSPVAYDWLRKRVLTLADAYERGDRSDMVENRLQWAILALGDTRMQSAGDDAVAILERFGDKEFIAIAAVRVVEEVQAQHGPQPRAQDAVRRYKVRREPHRRALQDAGGDDDAAGGIENALNPSKP